MEYAYDESKPLGAGGTRRPGSSSSLESLSLELSFGEKDVLSSPQGVTSSPPPGTSFVSPPRNSFISMQSTTQSPSIQMMERPPGYDPNRIPASVFNSKPTTPMEWSVASNESLFSIQVGNNSFSRDIPILMGKSGELPRLDGNFPLPPVTEAADTERMSEDIPNESEVVTEVLAETTKVVPSETPEEDHSKETPPPAEGLRKSMSVSHRSDASGNSTRSFAFPVLGEGGRSSSAKVGSEKQQPQTPVATTNTTTAKKSCFSCFSCCC